MLAAGGDLEVFWRVYTQHNRGHIDKVLVPYKIGAVTEADMRRITAGTHYDASAYEVRRLDSSPRAPRARPSSADERRVGSTRSMPPASLHAVCVKAAMG